ncbi:TetR/AcrR family transcriptional regulator [Vulcanisaeta thermophila]|uniref:TetR/AcrR family transcriptional regulator n=1 Tax=Vulcanisaeta thermophila TaxID=867917 RepID=UPI000853CB88|nr:TetR/AcrR family transcriptional regulator [Vulcanisaeta thermophila]
MIYDSARGIKDRLIHALSRLLMSKSYFDISMRDIAHEAGISVSTFYLNYKSKEDILREYINDSITRIKLNIEGIIHPGDPTLTVRSMVKYMTILWGDPSMLALHRVLREIEFIDRELASTYYRELLNFMANVLTDMGIHGDPHVISAMILGSSQFIHLFRKILGVAGNVLLDIDIAGDVLLKGLGKTLPMSRITELVKSRISIYVPDIITLSEDYGIYNRLGITGIKKRLIISALKLLSRKSFRETKITEVVNDAGYAVGTFYRFYNSKRAFLMDLVRVVGSTVRRFLSTCVEGLEDRVEVEIAGTTCFLNFVNKNGQIYNIVRESEFIDLEIARNYYITFMNNYSEKISRASGQVITYDPQSLSIVLMGINHLLGMITSIMNILPNHEAVALEAAKVYSNGIIRM